MNCEELRKKIELELNNPEARNNFIGKINEIGGKLFQYRSCNKSNETIFDLKNIEEKTIYLNVPSHFNDPFDSKIAIDKDKMLKSMIKIVIENIVN